MTGSGSSTGSRGESAHAGALGRTLGSSVEEEVWDGLRGRVPRSGPVRSGADPRAAGLAPAPARGAAARARRRQCGTAGRPRLLVSLVAGPRRAPGARGPPDEGAHAGGVAALAGGVRPVGGSAARAARGRPCLRAGAGRPVAAPRPRGAHGGRARRDAVRRLLAQLPGPVRTRRRLPLRPSRPGGQRAARRPDRRGVCGAPQTRQGTVPSPWVPAAPGRCGRRLASAGGEPAAGAAVPGAGGRTAGAGGATGFEAQARIRP